MTTTTEYAYRWQLTAHRILGELVTEAQATGLPPLMWTLATTGALTGEASGLGTTPDEQRAAVAAWARHLGATVTETPRSDGRVSLAAPFERDGERRGIIRAELFPEFPEDETAADESGGGWFDSPQLDGIPD